MQIFRPFEKQTCPVTGKQEELDPIYGISLDGLASKIRRGEIVPETPWALHPEVGFETRFHAKRVCNVVFRTLHKGFTRGSMLANFGDDVLWMRNLGLDSGKLQTLSGETIEVENCWRKFLSAALRDVKAVYFPENDEEDEFFSFTGEAKINSRWFSFRAPTAAGCVVDVPDVFSGEEKPCEIPITFRDFDYLRTVALLAEIPAGLPPETEWKTISGKFFDSNVAPAGHERVGEWGNAVRPLATYVAAGHGYLAAWKTEQTRLRAPVRIPQLELRESITDGLGAA